MSLLRIENLKKVFGGLVAVNGVTFTVSLGQIKAIIGPNGAGKTTIFNLLTGIERADSGKIFFRDNEITRVAPYDIVKVGIARTFQNNQVFQEMSVLDNIKVGRHCRTKTFMLAAAIKLPFAISEEKDIHEKAFEWASFVGLSSKLDVAAGSLPHGERHLLEIARAMASEPELLLLDEPASGLNSAEVDRLAETIYQIQDRGVTVILVEHDMGLVMDISDEVVVLDQGVKIAEGPPLLIQEDEKVIAAYLGEEVDYA